jgi:parvulin-like peptidyl-prolyl isomerase
MSQELDEQQRQVMEDYKLSYLASYVEQITMYQAAKQEGLTVTDEVVEEYLKNLVAYYGVDEEGFKPIQASMGFTDASIRDYLKDGMQISELFEFKTKDITEPETSPEEYYNQNPLLFRSEEERTVRHILVEEQAEAEAIIAELQNGADFAGLVSRSTDPSAAANNGVIGPFYADGSLAAGGGLVESFSLASFALEEEGQFTLTPVESDYGYHVIILDEIKPASMASFAEVEEQLTADLVYEAKNTFFESYYQSLVEQAEIMYEEGYDPAAD